MLRAAHVVARLHHGGVETWLMQIAEQLRDHGILLDALTTRDSRPDMREQFEAIGGQVWLLPPPQQPRRFVMKLRTLLRERQYDIIHSHMHWFNGVILSSAIDLVPVRIAHARTDTRWLDQRQGLMRKLYTHAMRQLTLTASTHLVSISRQATLCQFGLRQASNVTFMPTAIDFSPFRAPRNPTLRTQFGLAPSNWVVAQVGRLEAAKNHHFMLAAFQEIVRHSPEARLLIVGDGALQGELQRQCHSLNISQWVVFAGSRPDIANILKSAADVCVLPSLWEGLGRVAVEAQAANVPLICSEAVAPEAIIIPELVDRGPLGSPRDFAKRVLAMKDHHLPSADISLKRVEGSAFNIQKAGDSLSHLYETAAKK